MRLFAAVVIAERDGAKDQIVLSGQAVDPASLTIGANLVTFGAVRQLAS